MYLKTYQLDLVKLLSATRLAWQAALKKTKVKLLIDTDMVLIVEKGIKYEYVMQFISI